MRLLPKLIVCLTLNYFIPVNSFAQNAPVKLWDRSFGGDEDDVMTTMILTSDGNFLLCGGSLSGVSSDKSEPLRFNNPYDLSTDYWIVKMTPGGSKIWDKTLGGYDGEALFSSFQTQDGGYLLIGFSLSDISGDKTIASKGNDDLWIVKVNATGIKQWEKVIGGNAEDGVYTAISTADGGYLLGGYSKSGISGDKSQANRGDNDFWLVKIDAAGNKVWDKTMGGVYIDFIRKIIETPDGGFLLCGNSESQKSGDKISPNYGSYDYWVVKTDGSGNLQWEKSYGGADKEDLYAAVKLPAGGYMLAGTSTSGISGNKTAASKGKSDFWLVRIDESGNILGDSTIGGNDDDILRVAQVDNDGGLIFAGSSWSGITGDKSQARVGTYWGDYWIIKTDASGKRIWDKTFGGDDDDIATSVLRTTDNGYLLGGYTFSSKSGDKTEYSKGSRDYWIVKLVPPNFITTGALTSNSLCAGNQLSISYSASGVYYSPNTFLAQLSNAAGSFAAPINIGIITSNNLSGTIPVTIPVNTSAGSGYRIRIISSNLATIGSDNGTNITINRPPSITINDASVCEDDNLTLSASPVANASYAWKGPNGFESFSQLISINNIKSNQAGVYKLTVTVDGCSSIKDVNVSVNPLPLAVAGNSQIICSGNFTTLGATAVPGNTYSWTSNPAGYSASIANPVVYPVSTTTYFVKETTARGCLKTNQVTITVNPTPQAPLMTPVGTAAICAGDQLLLTASGTNGHQWYKDAQMINGATGTTFNANTSGVYTVKITNNNCISPASSGITITANPLPATPIITAAGNVLSSSSAINNQWLLNGIAISNATARTYTALSSGSYTVRVSQNGCQATSAAYNFTVTGIVDPAAWNGDVKVFPNPVVQTLFIKNDGNRKLTCQLLDVLGRKVKETNLLYRSGSIEMNGLGGGVYYLLLTDNIKKESIRMTVVKQ